jgi:hypothetical protein
MEEGGRGEELMRRAGGLAAVLALLAFPTGARSQESRDRVRLEAERAVLEYENGDLDSSEATTFLKLADRGVADVEALVAPGLPDWARRRGRIRFVVSSRIPISRTWRHTVALPLARVRSRSAPYLHETVHALVPVRGDRVWLSEGLASYLESWVSENRGGYDAHIFTRAGDRGIYDAARRYLATEPGRAVLPWVGGRGEPPSMEEDRSGVARPFYVLSQSLTKHVVDAAGLAAVVQAVVGGGEDGLLRATGRADEDWKREWLHAIGASTLARAKRSPSP